MVWGHMISFHLCKTLYGCLPSIFELPIFSLLTQSYFTKSINVNGFYCIMMTKLQFRKLSYIFCIMELFIRIHNLPCHSVLRPWPFLYHMHNQHQPLIRILVFLFFTHFDMSYSYQHWPMTIFFQCYTFWPDTSDSLSLRLSLIILVLRLW